jgi:CubicO group peptidase (beta-lactamase class C family)
MSEKSIQQTLENLDTTLIEFINKHKLPGLAVGIIRDGKLIETRSYGYADLEREIPVSPETVFRIGSISKTFTTAGIMQLWEQGKLDLDDPVNNYLKDYVVLHDDPEAPPVTFRHMITHTSGIGEVRSLGDMLKPVGGLGAKPEEPEVPLSEYYGGLLQPEVYPGTKWAYANHAYATLGQLVEDISGQPLGEYAIEHIFEPLGMHKSDYFLTDRVRDDLASAYTFKKGHFDPVKYLRIEVPGAGSIFSTVNDMAKYVAALMNKGANEYGRYVKPETFEQMLTPQLEIDPRLNINVGLYFVLTELGDDQSGRHRVIWHNGGWPGFSSSMWVAPDDGLGIVVFTNTSSGVVDLISMTVLRGMLDVPHPADKIPVKGLLESPHDWPKLCGFYAPQPGILTNARFLMGTGGEVEVFTKDNHLAVRSLMGGTKKATILHRVAEDDPLFYQGVSGEGVERTVSSYVFVENEQGEVVKLLNGTAELYKRPYPQSLKFKLTLVAGSLAGLVLCLVGKKIVCKD